MRDLGPINFCGCGFRIHGCKLFDLAFRVPLGLRVRGFEPGFGTRIRAQGLESLGFRVQGLGFRETDPAEIHRPFEHALMRFGWSLTGLCCLALSGKVGLFPGAREESQVISSGFWSAS